MDRILKLHGIYKHFKGHLYIVEGTCYNADGVIPMVLYRSLDGQGVLWVRNLSEFLSEVDHEKYPEVTQKYRFEEYTLGD